MRDLTQALADWIAHGGREIGEIYIDTAADRFVLFHRADAHRSDLVEYIGAEVARDLAQYDDAGEFRPLKTAPNLRRGWKLCISGLPELRCTLDYFYPAMLGIWFSRQHDSLPLVPLRETLARQTGMYAVTKNITDAQAQTMIGHFCRTDGGCLKKILWTISPGAPVTSLPPEKFRAEAPASALPLLCHEACNLLVAEARKVVKKGEVPA